MEGRGTERESGYRRRFWGGRREGVGGGLVKKGMGPRPLARALKIFPHVTPSPHVRTSNAAVRGISERTKKGNGISLSSL